MTSSWQQSGLYRTNSRFGIPAKKQKSPRTAIADTGCSPLSAKISPIIPWRQDQIMVSPQWAKSGLAFCGMSNLITMTRLHSFLSQAHFLHCPNLGAGSNPSSTPMVDSISQGKPSHSPQWFNPLDSQHDLTPQTPPQKGASILMHPLQLTACFLSHESQHTPHLD